jgi:phage protein D
MIQAAFVRKNWHGDGKDIVLDCGEFELDAVTADGPPSIITIKGTSLPYGSQIRQTLKSRSWEAADLKTIAGEIAADGGMTLMFESANNPSYTRREQINQSDMAFLSRLCHDAGISLKATDNIIVLFDQAKYEAKPPVLEITRGDGSYTKWRLLTGAAGTKYSSCRVSYADPSTGRVIEGFAFAEGQGRTADGQFTYSANQQLEVFAKVRSADEAETLAEKHLRLKNKYGYTARFTLPGCSDLMAGLTVLLTGWGAWSGKYIIRRARHTIDRAGYTTEVEMRQVLEDAGAEGGRFPPLQEAQNTITYNTNGGTGQTPPPQTFQMGQAVTLPALAHPRDLFMLNHTFDGWRDSVSGRLYAQGESMSFDGSVVLNAAFTLVE